MGKPRKTRVLIVDPMPLARKALLEALTGSDIVEVAGTASTPGTAVRRIEALRPDVILLDLEDPASEETLALAGVVREAKIPVILFTTSAEADRRRLKDVLPVDPELALDKPTANLVSGIFELAPIIEGRIRKAHIDGLLTLKDRGPSEPAPRKTLAAVHAPTGPISRPILSPPPNPSYTLPHRRPTAPPPPVSGAVAHRIIALGASTGGTEVLSELLATLPREMPGIVIVQHMPAGFTRQFAERLDQLSQLDVKEAEDGDLVAPGTVLLAPGGRQLRVMRQGDGFAVRVQEEERVSGHCPSVDVLLSSVAQAAGSRGIGVVLTGMGKDGAEGLLKMRQAGARTFAQDERSSVVYGMPGEANRLGAAERLVAAADLPRQLEAAARGPVGSR